MKRFLFAAALISVSATAANAQINIDIGLSNPQPVYAAPRPYYEPPHHPVNWHNDRDRHRRYDWEYWQDHQRHGPAYGSGHEELNRRDGRGYHR